MRCSHSLLPHRSRLHTHIDLLVSIDIRGEELARSAFSWLGENQVDDFDDIYDINLKIGAHQVASA